MAELLPFEVTRDGAVATIAFLDPDDVAPPDHLADIHPTLGVALHELRWDSSVRVIVMTGKRDGYFQSMPTRAVYDTAEVQAHIGRVINSWNEAWGSMNTNQMLALIEKPIVAKVNGDVSGFGQSIMFACDFVVAREDAQVADGHLAMGDIVDQQGQTLGAAFGMVPGDGAIAWLPGLMTTTKMKEYLMLSRVLTARELADMDVINYAVPLEQLDAVTEQIVAKLLARPAHALALTKRLINKHLVNQLNLSLDLGDAYLKLGLSQLSQRGFQNQYTLEGEPG
jgi:enoyl-CoA hydratase/carnithine racemase